VLSCLTTRVAQVWRVHIFALANVNSLLLGARQINPDASVRVVFTGKWEDELKALPNFVIGGYDKDYVRSSPFGAGASPEAINAAKTAMQAMKNGDAVFVGPIKDNAGNIAVPAGNDLRPLRRRTPGDELSDRGRRRLALIAYARWACRAWFWWVSGAW
jgi:hypothetical protein